MAKLKPGIFGHPTGRIGNVVFYTLNGQGVCRTIGEQTKDPSDGQIAGRVEMKILMEVLKPLQKFIKHGFEHQAKGTVCNPFNLATSYNKHHAIQGTYPNLSIDYKKVKLSSGTLPKAKDLQIQKTGTQVKITWDPTHAWAGDQHDDLVMVALYHPKDKKASLFLNAGKRNQGECFLDISDENLINEPIEAYLCFKPADGETISDSVYLGNINGSQEKIEKEKINKKYTEFKAHFDKVKANYEKQDTVFQRTGIKNKSLKNIEKEYEVLRKKLENLPGKPV